MIRKEPLPLEAIRQPRTRRYQTLVRAGASGAVASSCSCSDRRMEWCLRLLARGKLVIRSRPP